MELEGDMTNTLETLQEIGELIVRWLLELHYRDGALKGIQGPFYFKGKEYTITIEEVKNEQTRSNSGNE